ncbi:kicstor complex protein c12orf66 [Anaeramoeba flamelloides]|uniref:Kicstor complex protein c12orf66 n=1 Tax=Anaeramoeba flamelloides TaxID=1746091 RepID=A0AAV7YPX3_9EUKA|nr:kicstor complex protein c12orf66 [Anaeramoeba flamelloides]
MTLYQTNNNYDQLLKNQIIFNKNKKYINSHNIDFLMKNKPSLQNLFIYKKQTMKETRENCQKEIKTDEVNPKSFNLTDYLKLERNYLNMQFVQKDDDNNKKKKRKKNKNETNGIDKSLLKQYNSFSIFCEQALERKKKFSLNLKNGAEEESYQGGTNIKPNQMNKPKNNNKSTNIKEAENEITKNCNQFQTFSQIRIQTIVMFEKLFSFSKANKNCDYFSVLETLITTLTKQQSSLKNKHNCTQDFKYLLFLKKNLKLELEIMINLMQTERQILKFQFRKALFQLFKVKKAIKKWKNLFLHLNKINNLFQANKLESNQKDHCQEKHSSLYNYFFSKNTKTNPNKINNEQETKIQYPKLYLWVDSYYDLLISKINIYYSFGLQKTYKGAQMMNRTNKADEIVSFIEQFVQKNKAKSFCLISNKSSVSPNSRAPILPYSCENKQNSNSNSNSNNNLTIQFEKTKTCSNENQSEEQLNWGISQYPTIFSCPQDGQLNNGQYSSLISLILDSQPELNKNKKIIHFYDKKLKLSFFLMQIQKNITAVLIYPKKKNNFDKKSFNFLKELLKTLSNQSLFQSIHN